MVSDARLAGEEVTMTAFSWRCAFRTFAFAGVAIPFLLLPAAAQTRGGVLTIGIEQQVVGFDPVVTKTTAYQTVMAGGIIFGTPLGLDATDHEYPSNAVSVTPSSDGMVWTTKLRPNLHFSNGSPVTADDVAKHWTRILDPERSKPYIDYVSPYKEVVAVDPVTVETRLKHPWGAFASGLPFNGFLNWVMPAKYEASAEREMNRKPIGAGPYMLSEWNQDGGMVLVRNPHYWNPDAQHLDKIVLKFIPDENSRYAALRNGDIDFASVPMQQVQDARKNPALQVIKERGTGAFTVQFNTSAPPLDDVRVRQALAYATDRVAYRKVISSDEAEMAVSLWPAGSPWHCDDVVYPEYDLAKAQSLVHDYGKPVKLTLQVPAFPLGALIGELLQSFWKKAGVETEIAQVTVGPAYIGPVFAGKYQAVLWDLPDLPDPDFQTYAVLHSGSGANVGRVNDPVLDEALERGRISMDPAARKAAYCDVAKEMNKIVPFLLSSQHDYYAVANAKLRGVTHLRFGRFWPAEAWWEK
jgi:peptide/nickel transport system substrate-binding protein